MIKIIYFKKINGDWGLGIGDWGLGIGPNPQSPIPNPQSPIPNPHFIKILIYLFYMLIKLFILNNIYFYFSRTLNPITSSPRVDK